jgi:CxxH/CxxC protein (TIGR04129 family)
MFICCKEHMEEALDRFVDEYEEAPDVYLLAETSFTAWTAPESCDFCERHPIYLLV